MEAASVLACALRDPEPPINWADALSRFRSCKTDHGEDSSWAIAAFMRRLNDWATDEERAAFVPLTLRVANSRGSVDVEIRRALMSADWGIRQKLPEACDLLDLPEQASALRALDEIVDARTLQASIAPLNSAARDALDEDYRRARSEHISSSLALVDRMLAVRPER